MYVNRSRHDSRTMAMCLSEKSNYSDMLECEYFVLEKRDGMMLAEVSFRYPRGMTIMCLLLL